MSDLLLVPLTLVLFLALLVYKLLVKRISNRVDRILGLRHEWQTFTQLNSATRPAMRGDCRDMTSRERVYRKIEVHDALRKLESEGIVKRVLRPDGQIGYALVNNDSGNPDAKHIK